MSPVGRGSACEGGGPRARGRLQIALVLATMLTLAALVFLAAMARSATANPLTLAPVADSYVQADKTSATHGAETQLRADGSPVFRSYLRFNVQGLQGTVTRAVLRINTRSSHPAGYDVRGVADNSWVEGTVSFSNAPPVGAAVIGSSGTFASGVWTEVAVTPLVSGNGLVTFALTTANTTAMSLSSRESGAATAPQLVVTTGTAAPDTTAPSVPAGFTASPGGTDRIALAWSASTDDRGVSGYGVYRDGGTTPIATTTTTSFTNTGLAAGSTHAYRVDAVDAAGNRSARSAEATATTSTTPPPPPPPPSPGGTPITPVADSYVRSDQTGANYGTVTPLRLDGSPPYAAYLRFNVQGLSGPPSRALLRVQAGSNHSTGYSVGGVASTTWGETTITFANAPPIGATVGSSGALTSGRFAEVDVTPLVLGNGLVSLGLTTPSSTAMSLLSREAAAGTRPELVITPNAGPSDSTPPSVPAGLTAAVSGRTAIALSWSAATDDTAVVGYAIYRDGGATAIATTTGPGATAFTDTGLAPGSAHSYQVDAADAAGNRSARSAPASTTTDPADTSPPTAPEGLAAAASGRTAIALSWSAASDDTGVTGYAVYRDGGLVPIATTSGPTATAFTDTALTPGSTHSYQVDAVDAAANRSARSAPASTTTDPPDTSAPTVPIGLTAAAGGRTAIALSWSAATDDTAVAGYAIYRDGGLTAIGTTTGAGATTFTDDGLAPGSTHSYEVDAVDAAGHRSARSTPASTTTDPADTSAPTVPEGLAAVASGRTAIALSWSAATDDTAVTGYAIYRDGGATAIAATSPSVRAFTDTGLAPGSTHSYEVDAVDAAFNRSARSTPASTTTDPADTAAPTIPEGLTAAAGGPTAIALTWSAATDDDAVAGYAIYRDGATTPVASTTGPTATTFTDTGLTPGSTHSYEVDAVDRSTNRSGRSQPASATTPAANDPVIAAAGDIACDPTVGGFTLAGTANSCRMQSTSNMLLAMAPDAVLTLGDLQYEDATFNKFLGSYDPTWGRLKSITRPAPGNHDYLTTNGAGYYQYFGAAAGDPTKGYYSYDLGAWHLISLNSNCSPAGGCGVGSPQEKWLRADLAAHPAACTLAYWHHPRFSSGQHGSTASIQPLWQTLYDGNADVVLNGHDHDYERFAPQTPTGAADPARGIRQFVVGTGGKNHYAIGTPIANSESRNDATFGVLKLTLRPTSYEWSFLPEAGTTFTDSGSADCH
ncbi:MAG: hypothetical protein QOK40_2880 [Miltoncostaeaceae bacterium]|nr:hypothetical protein [Miltoncostaeaceae bacterium]